MARFKTRARTLDMLGRQQIAGIPNAISELFKNAHDAYANHAEVDFIRKRGLVLLRDDGVGMTEKEFLERWLTIGTESKVEGPMGLPQPPAPEGETARPLLGEKGIGRLAIAAIGSQVLVLTRARRAGKLQPIVAAFVPWGLFACPRIDLDDIDLPVRHFVGGQLPTREDVRELLTEAKQTIRNLQSRMDPATVTKLIRDVDSFDVDPRLLEPALTGPQLSGEGHGTHFFIQPVDETLTLDLEEPTDGKTAPPLTKMLIGFANTMTPGATLPALSTAFRDHRGDGLIQNLIEDREFFTAEDSAVSDHAVTGRYDEYGRFAGTVRIFERTIPYDLPPKIARTRGTACGPFAMSFAYVQGEARNSLLYSNDPERYTALNQRLDRLGGIYIYRDGIRILPYGNNDFDFLEIEERRNKGAGYYFFSYRRMFGAIELTREANGRLQEKAGREGFRQNAAYHELKSLVVHLLVQLAAEFFRESGPQAEHFIARREELERNELLRREREVQARSKRTAFGTQLDAAFAQIAADDPKRELEDLLASLEKTLAVAQTLRPTERAASAVIAAEMTGLSQLEALRKRYDITKPRGIALTKRLLRDWDHYRSAHKVVEQDVFEPGRLRLDELCSEAAKVATVAIDRRKRADHALNGAISRSRRLVRDQKTETDHAATSLAERIAQIGREALDETEGVIARSLEILAGLNLSEMSDRQFARERMTLEEEISQTAERRSRLLQSVREILLGAGGSLIGDATEHGPDALMVALEEELLALRERETADLELTQLGMAIEVVSHEFGASIKAVRSALKRMKGWADANDKLSQIYVALRASFDHLDGYLTLFTPLHRRLYRAKVPIKGSDIATYLNDLFGERLGRHSTTLVATKRFCAHVLEGYPSTFYPVFVNLIDNAIYWLQDRIGARTLTLDWDGSAMIVSDTGPGIAKRDRDAIFETGFTRKPGGRGLGLHISREVLKRAGYDLILAETQPKTGATFRIEPMVTGAITH